ncbi:tetratricopeptide repeat protein [Streptomyces sp. NPDC050161]|uniref:tetratricopeptide repeat protein n=1 Tax=Streptomyces sp. NPDC050161 TaxID=3365604 RepID=UPI0037994345
MPPPHQLPPIPRPLPGRADLAARIAADLIQGQKEGRSPVALLSGMPGVGKSALALLVADRLAPHFPDAVLYLGLRGFSEHEDPIEPEALLDRILSDLGIGVETAGCEAKSGALRTALARQSVLMVLDDAATADQVLPLLPGHGTSGVIITSRQRLRRLGTQHGAYMFQVGPLQRDDAVAALEHALSQERLRRVGKDLCTLADLCGCLPLALVIVAELLRHRPAAGIRELADELRQERTRLEAMRLADDELAVHPVLEYAVQALAPDAALLLWQAAIHPGPTISWSALRGLERAGGDDGAVGAIDALVSAHLLEPLSEESDRFRMHDLVRVYARQHAREHIDRADDAVARRTVEQVLEYELHQVWACDQVLDPDRRLPVKVSADTRVDCPSGTDEAMQLLDGEYETAMAVVQLAIVRGAKEYVWLLSMALVTYQWRRALYGEAQRNLEAAEFVARTIASAADRAMVHRMIAGCMYEQRAFEESAWHLERAVALSRQEQHHDAAQLGLACSLHSLGIVRRRQDRPGQARECWEQAQKLFQRLGDAAGEAATLNALGTLHHDDGDGDGALRLCTRSLRIFEGIGHTSGMANVLTTLAKIHLSRAEREPALASYAQAIRLYQQLDDWRYEATVQERYADALLTRVEDRPRAVAALERALVLRDRMGGEGAQELADRLAGLR